MQAASSKIPFQISNTKRTILKFDNLLDGVFGEIQNTDIPTTIKQYKPIVVQESEAITKLL